MAYIFQEPVGIMGIKLRCVQFKYSFKIVFNIDIYIVCLCSVRTTKGSMESYTSLDRYIVYIEGASSRCLNAPPTVHRRR